MATALDNSYERGYWCINNSSSKSAVYASFTWDPNQSKYVGVNYLGSIWPGEKFVLADGFQYPTELYGFCVYFVAADGNWKQGFVLSDIRGTSAARHFSPENGSLRYYTARVTLNYYDDNLHYIGEIPSGNGFYVRDAGLCAWGDTGKVAIQFSSTSGSSRYWVNTGATTTSGNQNPYLTPNTAWSNL
ncbi:hypothetical protein [Clostridium manihotivorum]|uniref:Uncharacterized protein n=1 Tax=Clostridium manihotivorum TaxID=2320868 RepID=A0A3R5U765_9CLOT|nr:hypothetical protein [Clostridium manihotivorum]QAA30517.1 hypothetical protein C1I91_01910 [Clostridium manihotivorum]